MEEKGKIKIVAGVDIFVAILFLIVGFLVVLFGSAWNDYVSLVTTSYGGVYSTSAPYSWLSKTPWIVIFLGVTSIVYGVKRMIDNILKMF